MFGDLLKNKQSDQTPSKTARNTSNRISIPIDSQSNSLSPALNCIKSTPSPSRLHCSRKRISFFESVRHHSPYQYSKKMHSHPVQLFNQKQKAASETIIPQEQNRYSANNKSPIQDRQYSQLGLHNQQEQLKLKPSYQQISGKNHQQGQVYQDYSQGLQQQLPQPLPQSLLEQSDSSQQQQGLQQKPKGHHRKQDSLMGSVCEFSDNTEQARKIPPQMQMQASKRQSQQQKQPNQQNQQFLAVNKDTGETYDLRNPASALELTQHATKAQQLKKNKLPWEEWWRQKKETNLQFLFACQQNDYQRCCELLDDNRGDLRAEVTVSDQITGWCPLHFACLNLNTQLVNKLIVNEANLNQETVNAVTPLIIAAEQGSEEIVILLLRAGADIDLQDENGNTALHIACIYDKYAVIDILVNRFKPDLKVQNKKGKQPQQLVKSELARKCFEKDIINNITNRNTVQLSSISKQSNQMKLLAPAGMYPDPQQQQQQLQVLYSPVGMSNKRQYDQQITRQIAQNVQQSDQQKTGQQKQTKDNEKQLRITAEDSNNNNNSNNNTNTQSNIIIQVIEPRTRSINNRLSSKLSDSHKPSELAQLKTSQPNNNQTVTLSHQNGSAQLTQQSPIIIEQSAQNQQTTTQLTNPSLPKTPSGASNQQKQQLQSNGLSKNSTPRSRENSKNRSSSFFSKKGFFLGSNKENQASKLALRNKQNQQSIRQLSTNTVGTSHTPGCSTAAASIITSSKSNSFQSLDQLVLASNKQLQQKVTIRSFIIHSMLGKGSFGDVYLVQKKDNSQFYAMKVLQKSKMMKSNVIKYALTERNVLSITNHPFIVKLNYSFQSEDKLFLILDFAAAGDMGKLLQRVNILSEAHSKIYLAEILLALEDLHKRDIIFRDLKPDNIVIDSEGHALLTDFGLSKEGVLDYTEGAKSFCGSLAYLAPEMLKRRGHGKGVDWYLFGVLMYEMLTGNPPYYANNKEDLFANIQGGQLELPSYLSEEAQSLLMALLERNPAVRLGCGRQDANEIKLHPFFKNVDWEMVLQRKVKPPEIELLKISLNNYNSEQFIENLIGQTAADNWEDKHISGWSFIANDRLAFS